MAEQFDAEYLRRGDTVRFSDRGQTQASQPVALLSSFVVENVRAKHVVHPIRRRALCVHRMAVSRGAAGGIGATILDWAGGHAAAQGKKWLRLDAWKDNEGLHRYYKAVGFTLV
ncbi:hypothetical protein [Streptomyces sp. LN245]|uniref:hypothetical protein n=1 Tax=Streptomyces sp. LN245 TaxID=3112975 RepID=UPI0037173919